MKFTSALLFLALISNMSACAPVGSGVVANIAPVEDGERMPERAAERAPITILISIDGFRPDYLHHGRTEHLDALAKAGVEARMRPSFPSQTFPNHEAIVTGLRPDHSGIVANIMRDPAQPETFNKSSTPFWWDARDPIWISATKQGVRSAVMFWPGSDVSHDGVLAADWKGFDPQFGETARVDRVIEWIGRPDVTRPRFITLYFDSVDGTGHAHGPDGPEMADAVQAVDAQIGRLVQALKDQGQPANLVILSDHGMRAIDPALTTDLDRLLPRDAYVLLNSGPFATLDPAEGRETEVAAALLRPLPRAQCWRKADVPARFHYGSNRRVAAFVCLAKPGGSIGQGQPKGKGNHGYDVDDPQMSALFIAHGPGFRKDAKVPPLFDNVDVYPMLGRLIGVTVDANDGDAATLDALVKQP